MMNEMISIILPVYNVEPYLDECIQSVLGQTYENIEIILIDDGSEDNCPAICDSWAEKDRRVRVIHQNNQGLSIARNVGIDVARGDYLCFVDSDDYIDKTLCEKVMDAFSKSRVDIVAFNFYQIDDSGMVSIPEHKQPKGILSSAQTLEEIIYENLRVHAWSKVYKRELFSEVRFPAGHNFEDVGTVYKLVLKSEKVCVLEDRLYFYRQRRGSIMNAFSDKSMIDLYLMKKQRSEDLKPIYPELAEYDLMRVALCAKSVFDRSLWRNIDSSVLLNVNDFLVENKQSVLRRIGNAEWKLFYRFPKIYTCYRLLRHRAGEILR